MCGAATDFALRAIAHYNMNAERKIGAMLLAPCCHHKCTYADYVTKFTKIEKKKQTFFSNSQVARDFLTAQNFQIADWPALRHAASWAVCGFKKNNKSNSHCDNPENSCPVCAFTMEKKIKMGQQVKALLELGRANFVRSLGYDTVKIRRYVDSKVSPENIVIIAK